MTACTRQAYGHSDLSLHSLQLAERLLSKKVKLVTSLLDSHIITTDTETLLYFHARSLIKRIGFNLKCAPPLKIFKHWHG